MNEDQSLNNAMEKTGRSHTDALLSGTVRDHASLLPRAPVRLSGDEDLHNRPAAFWDFHAGFILLDKLTNSMLVHQESASGVDLQLALEGSERLIRNVDTWAEHALERHRQQCEKLSAYSLGPGLAQIEDVASPHIAPTREWQNAP